MEADRIYEEVGLHLRAHRRRLGLTLEDLGELSGLSGSYIGQIERNVKKASLKSLALLAGALGVRVGALFDARDPPARLLNGRSIEAILSRHTPSERKLMLCLVRRMARGLRELRGPSPASSGPAA